MRKAHVINKFIEATGNLYTLSSPGEAHREVVTTGKGEKILNKKAVYEPSHSQRCHQLVCNRRWTIAVLVTIGLFVILIAIIAAFARPGSSICQIHSWDNEQGQSQGGTTTSSPSPATPSVKDYISTDGRPFPWKDIRLPRSMVPETYEIFLHPNISRSVFSGNVRIRCTVVSATDWFILHIKELNVTGVRVLRGEVAVEVADHMEYRANQQLYVHVEQRLAADSKVVLVLDFRGTLDSKLTGFYKSSYTTSTGQTREIATTHFEPTDARAAFPCFDEPDLKANFSLKIVRDAGHITLFNMPLRVSSPYQGDLWLDEYEMSVRMSTYLVAFVVCDFKNVTGYTSKKVMVRVFAPEDQISQAEYGLDVAVKVLDYYEDFFGVPYPLPKQDLIGIPDFSAGAMENWGLITFRMTSILYDPEKTSPRDKQWITITIAHELAHQWFGNIVTMKWWDDLWLNEGFAAFVEYIGSNIFDPSFKLDEQFVLNTMQRAFWLDALTNSHPIKVKVSDPAQINEIFDDISYEKGASIISMLQAFLGEEVFQKGLQNYLTTHSYDNARTDDLWQSLQEASSMPKSMTVKDVMDTWTLQEGYPVVSVSHKAGTQHLLLTQTRFLLTGPAADHSSPASPFNYTWKIPVTYKSSSNMEPKLVWMKDAEMTLPVTLGSNDWIKFNLQVKGFYRVNYEESLWQQIIQQLKNNLTVFSSRDRAGLLDDAFSLARAGLLSYEIVFDLLGYLDKETEYLPLKTAINGYAYIADRIYLSDAYPKLQKYMLGRLSGQLSAMGWEQQTQPLNQFLQTALLSFAIEQNNKETIQQAQQRFLSLDSVPKNLRQMVVSAAVAHGDEDTWMQVFHNYTSSSVPTEKDELLATLTYTRDPRRIQLFLMDSMNDKIVRSQDTEKVISMFSSSHAAHVFTWRFVEQNWDMLYNRYGQTSFTLGSLLTNIVSPFNTQFDYDEVKSFFSGRDVGAGSMGLKQSLEVVQSHVAWINQNQHTISSWFINHQP